MDHVKFMMFAVIRILSSPCSIVLHPSAIELNCKSLSYHIYILTRAIVSQLGLDRRDEKIFVRAECTLVFKQVKRAHHKHESTEEKVED